MIFADTTFGDAATEIPELQATIFAALASVNAIKKSGTATPEQIQLARSGAVANVTKKISTISAGNQTAAQQLYSEFLKQLPAPPPPPAPPPKRATTSAVPAAALVTSAWDNPTIKYGGLAALAGVVGYVLWKRSKKG